MARLQFQPPAENLRGPAYLESLLEGWIAMCGDDGLRLGITTQQGNILFLLEVPDRCHRILAMQLFNAYPGSQIQLIPHEPNRKHPPWRWLRLAPDAFPITHYGRFVDQPARQAIDPLESLLEAIKTGQSGRAQSELWLECLPCRTRELDRFHRSTRYVGASFPATFLKNKFHYHLTRPGLRACAMTWLLRKLSKPKANIPDDIQNKISKPLVSIRLRVGFGAEINAAEFSRRKLSEIQSALRLLLHPQSIFFVENKHKRASFLLSTPEVATLWHFPTSSVHVPRVDKQQFMELEPPANLARPGSHANILTLGRVCFRNEHYKFGIDIQARRRHLWILGKTGMGKTTLLQSIIRQDMDTGRGLAVLEPHGDLAEASLKHLPKYRKNDLVYFDPADINSRVTFNPLLVATGSDKTLVADGVLTAFQKVFGLDESHAPRLLHIFRNCLMTLVETPGATLMDVQRILVEPLYRKTAIARVSNPVVRSFWLDEFAKWSHHDRTLYIASLQNKLGAFLTNDKLQRVLGDSHAKLNLRRVMDDGKILIVNLSKGRLGENASELLGTLIVSTLQLAAMSRADVPEADRRDFSIIMDEFQNFATPSIATFLSEARKYRTHLILANQFTQQIPEDILAAIWGNVANQIVFQVGASDAQLLEAQFAGSIQRQSLMSIPNYHAYGRLLIDKMPSRPFSLRTSA